MGIRDIFQLPSSGKQEESKPTPEEQDLMDRVARRVVKWGMTVPAIIFLESVKPLNYIGSQVMVFFEPFVTAILDLKDYSTLQRMMEKRQNVENLLLTIEKFDAEAFQKEKEIKMEQKVKRKRRRRALWAKATFWKKGQ